MLAPLTALTFLLSTYIGCLSTAYSELESDTQLWAPITLEADLPKNFRLEYQFQPRWGEDLSQLTRTVHESRIGYDINEKISMMTGFIQENKFDENRSVEENQTELFQEIQFRKLIRKNYGYARFRVEEFLENKTPVRLRFRVGDHYPLGKSGKWNLSIENELFINVNDNPGDRNAGFDQNRFTILLGRDIGKSLRVQVGYLMQFINESANNPYTLNHCIMVQTSYHLQGRGRHLIKRLFTE